jgi:hypothetical protein
MLKTYMGAEEFGRDCTDWIHLAQDRCFYILLFTVRRCSRPASVYVYRRGVILTFQKLEKFGMVSKNIKVTIYRTIIVPVFCMGVKLGHSH